MKEDTKDCKLCGGTGKRPIYNFMDEAMGVKDYVSCRCQDKVKPRKSGDQTKECGFQSDFK